MNPRRFLILVVTVWLAAQIGNILISGFIAWSSISDEFLEQNQKIAELVSNRLAHHEAIMGSLKALTRGTSDKIFQRLTSNVFKNYPRIQSVKIYRFDSRSYSAKPELLYEAPSKSPAFPMSVLNALPRQETNIVRVYDAPAIPNHYLSTMVSNNRQGLIAVVLLIDSTKLFDLPPASYPPEINLTLNDVLVFGSTDHDNGRHDHEKDISSILKNVLYADLDWDRSGYRFKIHVHRPIEFGELVTLPEVIRFALLSLATILGVSYGRYQTLVSRQSKQAEEKAIKRSAMLEHENRLSHAARVNQVGELASGIIHELTQPLSALLSQSQAGIMIMEKLQITDDLLNRALSANIIEAKRAGEIMDRIRDYIVKKPVIYEELDLNIVVSNTVNLVQGELDKQNVVLELQLLQPSPRSNFSAIELEQVIHNLIRNATDALGTTTQLAKKIIIKTDMVGPMNIIRISDNGPGIKEHVLSKIFEPFFTTKTNGMGLGLSLCSKLLERVGGTLHAASADGAVFTIALPKLVGLTDAGADPAAA